jgi:mRNA interferase MazF
VVVNVDLKETQIIIDAAKEQVYLQGKTHQGPHAKPKRGQVFNCHFGAGVGSEFQKLRPCIVLSNHANNMNSAVVVVAPITSTHKNLPVCVPIAAKLNANGEEILHGSVNLSGLRSVSSYRLAGRICELDNHEMKAIDAAIARHLDIMRYYNALENELADKKIHAKKLTATLSRLRQLTGADNNEELVVMVEKLLAEGKD